MACEERQKRIGQHTYTVRQMPPSEALPYHAELGTLFAEVLGPLMRSATGDGLTQDAVAGAIGDAAAALRAHMPPKRYAELVNELVVSHHVKRDGVGVVLDVDFSGSEGPALYQLLAFVLEVNFAPFFGASGLGGLADRFKDRMMSSPGPSPG